MHQCGDSVSEGGREAGGRKAKKNREDERREREGWMRQRN